MENAVIFQSFLHCRRVVVLLLVISYWTEGNRLSLRLALRNANQIAFRNFGDSPFQTTARLWGTFCTGGSRDADVYLSVACTSTSHFRNVHVPYGISRGHPKQSLAIYGINQGTVPLRSHDNSQRTVQITPCVCAIIVTPLHACSVSCVPLIQPLALRLEVAYDTNETIDSVMLWFSHTAHCSLTSPACQQGSVQYILPTVKIDWSTRLLLRNCTPDIGNANW